MYVTTMESALDQEAAVSEGTVLKGGMLLTITVAKGLKPSLLSWDLMPQKQSAK